MKKLLSIVLALALLCLCGIAAAETLNVAYMPNYGSLWAIETAIHQGYLAEEGLEVNLVEFADGPTIIAAMESGSIDIGYIGQGAHKLCINGRATIFALSHVSNGDALIGGKGIATVEGYYRLQRDTFVANGAVEKDPVPEVSEYVMLDLMVEAGK